MKIYISGQISGLPINEAKELFDGVEKEIEKSGHTGINPFKIVPYHPDLTWSDYMGKDIEALIDCDAIFMLKNWRNSKGARIELAIAKEFNLGIAYEQ